MNVVVLGSSGQLGTALQRASSQQKSDKWFFHDRDELDISDKTKILEFCKNNHIDWIINAAAYTLVDQAEKEKEDAFAINAEGTKNLAEISVELGIKLVHVSTDFVFDGFSSSPYQESDATSPQSVYGASKLQGEQEIINSKVQAIIIRTSWLYGKKGANFVNTMLRLFEQKSELGVIDDQIGTPTYVDDLAETIVTIISEARPESPEIYHYSNEGVASWYDFAHAIATLQKTNCQIKPISTEEYPAPAKRPPYTVLNKKKIKEHFGLIIPHWRDSLERCLLKPLNKNKP